MHFSAKSGKSEIDSLFSFRGLHSDDSRPFSSVLPFEYSGSERERGEGRKDPYHLLSFPSFLSFKTLIVSFLPPPRPEEALPSYIQFGPGKLFVVPSLLLRRRERK